jgi:hypothetical protein
MSCLHEKCYCHNMCYVAGCILQHQLFYGRDQEIVGKLIQEQGKNRDRLLINLLQEKQRPKVPGKYVGRYYTLLKRGIDVDNGKYSKKEIESFFRFRIIKHTRKSIVNPKKWQKDGSGREYVFFENKKCYRVGELKTNVGNWAIAGQRVFADQENEKYILFDGRSLRGYYQSAIEKYVLRKEYTLPKQKKKKGVSMEDMMGDVHLSVNSNTSHRNWNDWVETWKAAPEPNFHEEQNVAQEL